eukprot:1301467-Amphidinium_carterae.1
MMLSICRRSRACTSSCISAAIFICRLSNLSFARLLQMHALNICVSFEDTADWAMQHTQPLYHTAKLFNVSREVRNWSSVGVLRSLPSCLASARCLKSASMLFLRSCNTRRLLA